MTWDNVSKTKILGKTTKSVRFFYFTLLYEYYTDTNNCYFQALKSFSMLKLLYSMLSKCSNEQYGEKIGNRHPSLSQQFDE